MFEEGAICTLDIINQWVLTVFIAELTKTTLQRVFALFVLQNKPDIKSRAIERLMIFVIAVRNFGEVG